MSFGAAGVAAGGLLWLASVVALARVSRRGRSPAVARATRVALLAVAGLAVAILLPLGAALALRDPGLGGGLWLARGLAVTVVFATLAWATAGPPRLARLAFG